MLRSTLTTTGLALTGLGMMWYAGGKLQQKGGFDFQPNPLGLKASPYGQVIAMAIQTPIDADWHGGLEIHDSPAGADDHAHHDHSDHDCDHHGPDCDHSGHETCTHDHSECEHAAPEHDHDSHLCSDPGCGHDHGPAEPDSLLGRLSQAVTRRTNPNPPTAGHQFYLRREIEKKLRFAYELDPSHYANYNTYHLFLVEPELGTSDETRALSRDHANSLAEHTIRYCLRETVDPRPALTAASAAYNLLEGMFVSTEKPDTIEMRKQLAVIDFCLKRHFELLGESTSNGNWERLSEMRQSEVLERSNFALKLREAAEKTIVRLESPEPATANHDPS